MGCDRFRASGFVALDGSGGGDVMALLAVLSIAAVAFGIGLAVLRLERSSRVYYLAEPQKAPFLGGGTPDSHAWQRYHVRYYSMTLLFIAFEMEMMFMYPWAVVYVEEGVTALAEMGMFLAILSIGILYGWRERIFAWQ